MPIFEYVCKECGEGFELLVRGRERPRCPACGSGKLTRKFSVFGFKSGSTVVASAGAASCSTCTPSPGQCATCR